jgi:hypothetical protein
VSSAVGCAQCLSTSRCVVIELPFVGFAGFFNYSTSGWFGPETRISLALACPRINRRGTPRGMGAGDSRPLSCPSRLVSTLGADAISGASLDPCVVPAACRRADCVPDRTTSRDTGRRVAVRFAPLTSESSRLQRDDGRLVELNYRLSRVNMDRH